jgi:hypothetical protein
MKINKEIKEVIEENFKYIIEDKIKDLSNYHELPKDIYTKIVEDIIYYTINGFEKTSHDIMTGSDEYDLDYYDYLFNIVSTIKDYSNIELIDFIKNDLKYEPDYIENDYLTEDIINIFGEIDYSYKQYDIPLKYCSSHLGTLYFKFYELEKIEEPETTNKEEIKEGILNYLDENFKEILNFIVYQMFYKNYKIEMDYKELQEQKESTLKAIKEELLKNRFNYIQEEIKALNKDLKNISSQSHTIVKREITKLEDELKEINDLLETLNKRGLREL